MWLLGRHANKFDDATFYKVERCDPYVISILVGHVSNFIFTVECLIKVMRADVHGMDTKYTQIWVFELMEWNGGKNLTSRRRLMYSERGTN